MNALLNFLVILQIGAWCFWLWVLFKFLSYVH